MIKYISHNLILLEKHSMEQVPGTQGDTLNTSQLYIIARKLSDEILLEEFVQSRGADYSNISEEYIKSKKQLKKKVIFTKLFYAIIFGILPVIPVFTYFEFINLVTSGVYEFELIIFSISLLYGFFFLLQFFNFLLMAILETTVTISGKATEWFKTLPLSERHLKRILYFTVFHNFDFPIIVIVLSFPVAMFIGTLNIFIFFISLGISFVNTFLALNLIIIISERLNRVLNINDVSSRKTFFIRLFNIFSYLFLMLGSIYLVQWASTSIGEFIELFVGTEHPEIINIILSSIPYPLSQCYLIALTFSPSFTNLPIWFGTSIGMVLLIFILYLSFISALKSIRRTYSFEPLNRRETTYIEDLNKRIKIKTTSSFTAFLRKDLTAASRDLKVLLSFIMPILLSFIFVIYLNLPNIDITEPTEFQIFRVWLSYLLVSPIISSILVFSLLNLESTGQTILESLPIIPREQAKAKLLLMFIILNLAILLPSLLFITSPRFLVFLIGIFFSLPFACIFLFISFELRIYFFGKRFKSYIVGDLVIGSNFFKLIIIFVVPLSLCVWFISTSAILFSFFNPFAIYLIIIFLITGFTFSIMFFHKLFPIRAHEIDTSKFQYSVRLIENPTFFTRHIWISIILLYILEIVGYNLIALGSDLIYQIPFIWDYPLDFFESLSYMAYTLTPILISTSFYILLYFIIVPKVLGIPYGRKKSSQFLNDIGLNWLRQILKYWRYIIMGTGTIIFFTFFLNILPTQIPYYLSANLTLISMIVSGFWFESIYRGIFLSFLSNRYKKSTALFLHLVVIFFYTFFMPSAYPILFKVPNNSLQFITYTAFFLLYNLVMGYIFLKSKTLIPNMIITLILAFFYYSPPIYYLYF